MVAPVADLKKAVDSFLSRGIIDRFEVSEIIAACDDRVRSETQVSAKKAVALGRNFVKQARPLGNEVYLKALRASGWAELVAGNYREAEKAYLGARDLKEADVMLKASIDRVLIDIYMYLDNYAEAEKRAKMALETFRRKQAKGEAAKTNVNYGNLLHRQDRHKEANRLYAQAARYFHSQKNDFATALCWYNQANTEVQLFDFETANRLFTDGRVIFQKLDQALYATGCLYGLAWLHMLQGDFHIALKELTECEAFYTKGNHPRELILCKLDRAESNLGLNLFLEARDSADEAARAAHKMGLTYEAAKGDLFSGKANFSLGQTRTAKNRLNRAVEGFKAVRNEGFSAATTLALAQLQRAQTGKLDHVKAAYDRFSKSQLPLWEAICDLQIAAEWPDESQSLKRLAHNKAAKTVPHLAARRYTLLGDRAARQKRISHAIDHWTKAAEILDAVRAKLPPIDMRSSFFAQQSEPHQRLVAAEYEKRPIEAAAWSERFKTVGIWGISNDQVLSNPARKRVLESLTILAGQVSAISGLIGHSGGERTSPAAMSKTHVRLHRQVRADLADLEKEKKERKEGKAKRDPDSSETIQALISKLSYDQPMVQFHVGTQDIIGFVHYRGTTHSHKFADGKRVVRDLVARWRYLVECAPASGRSYRKADLSVERELLGKIGHWLLTPLEIPSRSKRLLIIPEGQLASLPWSAIQNGKGALIDGHQLTISPSIRHHLYSKNRPNRSKDSHIFVGDITGLAHVRKETSAVRRCLESELLTLHQPCSRTDWPTHGKANIWHFTGHAQLRADNPFYSFLQLADGPLFAADFRLMKNDVNLVTLAACRTGQQTSLPGEEATGLVRSLLEMGARNVVASGWAVSDHSTSVWMDLIYTNYLNGLSVSKSIRQAAIGIRERYPSAFHWSAFSVFGAG